MYSNRINALPPYLFSVIDESKGKMIAAGVDVIDLGVGDPDLPTYPHIVDALREAVCDPKTQLQLNGVRNIRELSLTLRMKCWL